MNHEQLLTENWRIAAALRFGDTLRHWRKANNWTQYTIWRWSIEAGFQFPSYGNLSVIEQGKNLNLRPTTFIQFAHANQRIAEEDWGNIFTPGIKEKLVGSQPIQCREYGVWKTEHFFMLFTGIINPPLLVKK
jgi:hypothetical protein